MQKKFMNDYFEVKVIRILVIQALTLFLDKYPILESVLKKSNSPSEDWDFFMTVAGVKTYLLKGNITNKEKEKIINQLNDLDKKMPEALNNLNEFLTNISSISNETEKIVGIGIWVLWNIKGESPHYEESRLLAPAIGNYLLKIVEIINEEKEKFKLI